MGSLSDWQTFIDSRHPDAHLLQTASWGRLKSSFGWRPEAVQSENGGALILFHPLPMGFSLAYLPRGPVPATVENLSALRGEIDRLCRFRRAAFLKIEPDFDDDGSAAGGLRRMGFRSSPDTVQPPRTILVDIRGTEEEIRTRMKPKTRYNIRLAARHGVAVSTSEDIDAFARLMGATGERDSFAVHDREYYRTAFAEFATRQRVVLLLASYQAAPIAGLMAFAQGRRAWYLYGASSDLHRDVMAPYLLQWEAIRWARERGCTEYDLWGIPDADEAELESRFTARQDGLWGVYRFKRGFGGRIRRSVGAWDRVYIPPLYWMYRLLFARRAGAAA